VAATPAAIAAHAENRRNTLARGMTGPPLQLKDSNAQ
jgi:alkaline phosphatase